jgi:hypothetical protein
VLELGQGNDLNIGVSGMGIRSEKAFDCSFNSIEAEEMSINRASLFGV